MAEAARSEPRRSERDDAGDRHAGREAVGADRCCSKGVDARGFVFYTNTESRKGRELAANPAAALLFHWKSLGRQVRIEGRVGAGERRGGRRLFRHPAAHLPPRRLGVRSIPPAVGPSGTGARLAECEARIPGEDVPRPPHWRGIVLRAASF